MALKDIFDYEQMFESLKAEKLVAASSSSVATEKPCAPKIVASVAVVAGCNAGKEVEINNSSDKGGSNNDITYWINRVNAATTSEQVFNAIDNFRLLDWNDEDSARLSQIYIKRLEQIGNEQPATSATPATNQSRQVFPAATGLLLTATNSGVDRRNSKESVSNPHITTQTAHGEVVITGWNETDEQNMLTKVEKLRQHGYRLEADTHNQIHLQAPRGEVPQKVVDWLRDCRAPLLAWLLQKRSSTT